MEELRLPKCLTKKEAIFINLYDTLLLGKEFQAYDKIWNTETEVTNMYLHREISIGEYVLEYMPGIGQWEITDERLNMKLSRALRKVLIGQFGDYTRWDLIIFFNRAYVYVLYAVNNTQPELEYGSFSDLWMKDITLKRDRAQCELICACMVHCILDYEKDPHLLPLLEEIEWRLQASKNGINMDTLKVFQEKVAAANEQTEENTQGEEQPMEKKEEEAAPTDATKDVYFKNTALLQFKEEGGIEKWAGLVNEAIKDIEDHTLTSCLNNTMLAVMYYFASGWQKRKGIFINKPNVKQIVYFFLSRCAFNSTVCEKTLVNKLNELLKGDKEIVKTDETEQVKENIQKILAKNS